MKRVYPCFYLILCLCLIATAGASDLPGLTGSGTATTYDNDQRNGCGPTIEVGSLPYDNSTTLVGAGDQCGIRNAADHVYHLTITQAGSYTFSLCGTQPSTDTYIYLLDGCCSGNEIARDNDGCGANGGPSLLECITLSPGGYYLVVEAANANAEGPYSLHIAACENACDQTVFESGTEQLGETSYRFVQTVDGSSLPPYYGGPWVDDWPCAETGGFYGFDFLSWYDDDFGWLHTWPQYNAPSIVSVDSAFVYICAWDVDGPCPVIPPSRQLGCELDYVLLDVAPTLPAVIPYLEGSSQAWSVSRIPAPISELMQDGQLDVQLDIDANAQTCNWAVNVHRSQLVVYYTVNRPPYTPEGTASGCVTDDSLVCVTVTGPQPPDPDGDGVTHVYQWYRWDSGLSDWVLEPGYAGNCLPGGVVQTFESWKCEVVAVDDHGARSQPWSSEFIIQDDCGSNPSLGFDYGDLDTCYHTGTVNQGGPSHPVNQFNVAWLGDTITADAVPKILNLDDGDDGVVFVAPWIWMPCEQVCVDITITTGPLFDPQIHHLYLYGFKDGSYPANCSFGDRFCDGQAYECVIQGVEILGLQANSDTTRRFCFTDPGELEGQGRYAGVFRFRLLTEYLSCPAAVATNDPVGGETEDYIIPDLQLPVELLGFDVTQEGDAVVLRWSTASERDNDFFRIERRTSGTWSTIASRIPGAGTSPTAHSYSYRDVSVEAGTTYEYRLISVDFNGTAQVLGTQSIPVVQHDPVTISEYRLYPNYPNPFNPTTTIAFDLVEAGHVTLRIYDVMGREVAVLVNGYLPAGRHREVFDAGRLPSGLYLYKLTSGRFTDMQKMVLLK